MAFKENKIYTIVFTFIFSFIFIFILSFVNNLNKEKIDNNELLFKKKAILQSMQIQYSSDENVFKQYDKFVLENKVEDEIIYSKDMSNDQKVFAKIFIGSGLWGTITGVVGINQDISRIIGLAIISHSETPGLGGRIEEEWFLTQFNNEKIIDGKLNVQIKGNGSYDHEDGLFDSITGATRTSEYMEININDTLKWFKKMNKDKKDE